MVKLYIKDKDKIIEWYSEKVLALIEKKAKSIDPKTIKTTLAMKLYKSLQKEDFKKDVLALPIMEQRAKYKIIDEYCELVEESIKNPSAKVEESINDANNAISCTISWSFLDYQQKLKGELVQRLDIKVCLYCNRQYIQPVSYDGKKRYLADIDHILPKSKFTLFALSFYNLVPSCKVCNQMFKRNETKEILNPYHEGFGKNAILEIRYDSVKEIVGDASVSKFRWKVNKNSNDVSDDFICRSNNEIDMFKLDEVYKMHAEDFTDLLKKRYMLHSKSYKNSVEAILTKGGAYIDYDKLLYGVGLKEEDQQNELLSKAISDIVKYN